MVCNWETIMNWTNVATRLRVETYDWILVSSSAEGKGGRGEVVLASDDWLGNNDVGNVGSGSDAGPGSREGSENNGEGIGAEGILERNVDDGTRHRTYDEQIRERLEWRKIKTYVEPVL